MKPETERWWDWPAAIFFTLAMFCAASRLETTNWTEYLDRTQLLVLIAVGLGCMLGYSRFPPWFSFLYGLVFTVVVPIGVLASLLRSDAWLERVGSFFGRIGVALGQLVANQAVRDPLLFLLIMAWLFWICGLWGAYRLVRTGSPWAALIVPGVLTLVVEYSFEMYGIPDPGTLFSLLLLLFTTLLIARMFFLRARREWLARGNLVDNEVGFDLGRGAAICGVLLVAFSWYSPQFFKGLTAGTSQQAALTQDIQRFRLRFEKAVSSLRSPAPVSYETPGDSLLLGNGTVRTGETLLVITPTNGELRAGRYYWVGRIYDRYANDVWQSTSDQEVPVGPDALPLQYNWEGRTEETVNINPKVSFRRAIYYPGALISINQSGLALSNPTQPGETDITALLVEPSLNAGQIYQVRSLISTPSILDLRSARYYPVPEWVRERYLQLPEKFSPKILELAREITRGKVVPYDQAEAITAYLRDQLSYEEVFSQNSAGGDPLEWFLFDHKAGFCTYFASAEVLMLRSLGVPARMGVGYAQGAWNEEDQSYHVLAKDYHAWPEVYFPTLGWVPFEPTPAQPSLSFPSGETVAGNPVALPTVFATPILPQDALRPNRADQEADLPLTNPVIRFLIIWQREITWTLVALLFGFGLYRLLEKPIRSKKQLVVYLEESLLARGWRVPRFLREWARLARRSPMERMFAAVGELLRAWGKPPELSLTPAEQVSALIMLVPEVSDPAAVLLEEYQNAAYSSRQADYARARQAAGDLRSAGYRAWMDHKKSRKDR